MNWLKENPFLSGLIALVVVAGGGLGFLISSAVGTYTATLDSYTQTVQKLHQLQNKVPFPNKENLAKASALRDEYQQELAALESRLAALQVPVDASITPQRFQDDLRSAVNDITRKAEAAGVGLPENFYLGFDAYQQNLPGEAAAPLLARELGLIVRLMGDLIGRNPENPVVKSIDSFIRQPMPQESSASAGGQQGGQGGQGSQKKEEASKGRTIARTRLQVGFTAEQGKFRIALNNLLSTPQFLIIRSLTVENSSLVGPPVAAAANSAGAPLNVLDPPNSEKPASLDVLLGREVIKASLDLELLDFGFAAKAGGGEQQK
jgi:hypothetical protein